MRSALGLLIPLVTAALIAGAADARAAGRDLTPAQIAAREKARGDYLDFHGLRDHAKLDATDQVLRRLDMRDALLESVLSYPNLDTTDPTLALGSPPSKTIASLFSKVPFTDIAISDLGYLLRVQAPPSSRPDNEYVKLTKPYEPALRQKILDSGGGLTPADVMKLALDSTGGNYVLATLTAHNLLKDVGHIGRMAMEIEAENQAHAAGAKLRRKGADELPLLPHEQYVVDIARKLVNLRGDPDDKKDKFGPWYHIYGVLFLGSVTGIVHAENMVAAEHISRRFGLGSSVDKEKAAWDYEALSVLREITPKLAEKSGTGGVDDLAKEEAYFAATVARGRQAVGEAQRHYDERLQPLPDQVDQHRRAVERALSVLKVSGSRLGELEGALREAAHKCRELAKKDLLSDALEPLSTIRQEEPRLEEELTRAHQLAERCQGKAALGEAETLFLHAQARMARIEQEHRRLVEIGAALGAPLDEVAKYESSVREAGRLKTALQEAIRRLSDDLQQLGTLPSAKAPGSSTGKALVVHEDTTWDQKAQAARATLKEYKKDLETRLKNLRARYEDRSGDQGLEQRLESLKDDIDALDDLASALDKKVDERLETMADRIDSAARAAHSAFEGLHEAIDQLDEKMDDADCVHYKGEASGNLDDSDSTTVIARLAMDKLGRGYQQARLACADKLAQGAAPPPRPPVPPTPPVVHSAGAVPTSGGAGATLGGTAGPCTHPVPANMASGGCPRPLSPRAYVLRTVGTLPWEKGAVSFSLYRTAPEPGKGEVLGPFEDADRLCAALRSAGFTRDRISYTPEMRMADFVYCGGGGAAVASGSSPLTPALYLFRADPRSARGSRIERHVVLPSPPQRKPGGFAVNVYDEACALAAPKEGCLYDGEYSGPYTDRETLCAVLRAYGATRAPYANSSEVITCPAGGPQQAAVGVVSGSSGPDSAGGAVSARPTPVGGAVAARPAPTRGVSGFQAKSVEGRVLVRPPGGPARPLAPSEPIVPGSHVTTTGNGRVTVASPTSTVTVREGSEIDLPAQPSQPMHVDKGGLEVQHGPGPARPRAEGVPDFDGIESADGSVRPLGTRYRVDVDESGTRVEVLEGAVRLSGRSILRLVSAGQPDIGKRAPSQSLDLMVGQGALMARTTAPPSVGIASAVTGGAPSASVPSWALGTRPSPSVASPPPPAAARQDPWNDLQVQALIDQWLREARPPSPSSDIVMRYNEWAQPLSQGARSTGAPDRPADWTRHRYVWENRDRYVSTNLCTLGEFLGRRLSGQGLEGCRMAVNTVAPSVNGVALSTTPPAIASRPAGTPAGSRRIAPASIAAFAGRWDCNIQSEAVRPSRGTLRVQGTNTDDMAVSYSLGEVLSPYVADGQFIFNLKVGGQLAQYYGLRSSGTSLFGEVQIVTGQQSRPAPVRCQRDEITDQGIAKGRK